MESWDDRGLYILAFIHTLVGLTNHRGSQIIHKSFKNFMSCTTMALYLKCLSIEFSGFADRGSKEMGTTINRRMQIQQKPC